MSSGMPNKTYLMLGWFNASSMLEPGEMQRILSPNLVSNFLILVNANTSCLS
jgi:hypothetical protein